LKNSKVNVNWLPLIILFFVIIFIWVLSWFLILNSSYLDGWEQRASFGDMFGAINALFSGLAFAGVIYAIFLQRKELYLQRKELEQTRAELKGQKIQLGEQNKNIRLQRFETTFFNLINLHHNYIDRIFVPGFGNDQGRNSFQEFDRKYSNVRKNNTNVINISNLKDRIIESNKVFRSDYPNYLDIYMHNIRNVLSFLKNSENIDRSFYSGLFKSQLSYIELKFIHFFSADDYYGADFKGLIDEFKLTSEIIEKYPI